MSHEQARRASRAERRAVELAAGGNPAEPVPPPPPERDRAARGAQRDHQGQAGDRPDQDDPPPPRTGPPAVCRRRGGHPLTPRYDAMSQPTPNTPTPPRRRRKTEIGVVTSDKMNKT